MQVIRVDVLCQYPSSRIFLGMLTTVTPIDLALRDARESAGLTQAQLAEAVGVRQATISDLETGKSRRIELDLLEKLGVALGVEARSLIVQRAPEKRRGR